MEKRKAHYSLDRVKKMIKNGNFYVTKIALKTAISDFSYTEIEIIKTVLNLVDSELYKSMTSIYNNKLWQDVYKKDIQDVKAYIKIQIKDNNTVIISFKKE